MWWRWIMELWTKLELCSPSWSHWILDFCFHNSSSYLCHCFNLVRVVPSSTTNYRDQPSIIIRCIIPTIFCSKSLLYLKILPKTCLFHCFILSFKAFTLRWKTLILVLHLMYNSSHHFLSNSTNWGSSNHNRSKWKGRLEGPSLKASLVWSANDLIPYREGWKPQIKYHCELFLQIVGIYLTISLFDEDLHVNYSMWINH